MVNTQYIKAPNLSVQVGEETYAYRELGKREGIPVVFFVHLASCWS